MNKFFYHTVVLGCVFLQSIAPAQGARPRGGLSSASETPWSLKAKADVGLYNLLSPALGGRPLAIGMSINGVEHATGRGHFLSLNFVCNKLLYARLIASNPEVASLFDNVEKSCLKSLIRGKNRSVLDIFGVLRSDREFVDNVLEYRKIAGNNTLMMLILSKIISTYNCHYGLLHPGDYDPSWIGKVGILVSGVPAFVSLPGSDNFVSRLMDLVIVLRPVTRGFRMATFYSSVNGRSEFRSELTLLPRGRNGDVPYVIFEGDVDLFISYEQSKKPLIPEQVEQIEFALIACKRKRQNIEIESTRVNFLIGTETLEFWNNKAREFLSAFHGDLTSYNANLLLINATNAPFASAAVACLCDLVRRGILCNNWFHIDRAHPDIGVFPPLVVAGINNPNPAVFRLMLNTFKPKLDDLNIVLQDNEDGSQEFCAIWPTALRDESGVYYVLSWLAAVIRAKVIWDPKYPGEENPSEDILKISVEYGGPDVVNVIRTAKIGNVNVKVMPPLFFAALNSTSDLQCLLGLPYVDTGIKFLGRSLAAAAIEGMQQNPQEQEQVDRLRALLSCDKVKLDLDTLQLLFEKAWDPRVLPVMLGHGRRSELVSLLQQLSTDQLVISRNAIAQNRFALGLQNSVELLQMFQAEVLPMVKEREITSLTEAEAELASWQKESDKVQVTAKKSVDLFIRAVSLVGQEPALQQQVGQWKKLTASHSIFDMVLQKQIDRVRTDLRNAEAEEVEKTE
jgi:hypothetical protein